MAGSNQTLQIKMFGKFSMKNGNYAFPQEKKKSKQVGLLFAYLLAVSYTHLDVYKRQALLNDREKK